MKAFLLLAATTSLACSAMANTCVAKWNDAHAIAVERGYNFATSRTGGAGSCFVHNRAFVAAAANDTDVTCDVAFFVGASMQVGWSISLLATGGTFSRLAPDPMNRDGILRIRFTAKAGSTTNLLPTSVSFSRAGECKSWLEAIESK